MAAVSFEVLPVTRPTAGVFSARARSCCSSSMRVWGRAWARVIARGLRCMCRAMTRLVGGHLPGRYRRWICTMGRQQVGYRMPQSVLPPKTVIIEIAGLCRSARAWRMRLASRPIPRVMSRVPSMSKRMSFIGLCLPATTRVAFTGPIRYRFILARFLHPIPPRVTSEDEIGRLTM